VLFRSEGDISAIKQAGKNASANAFVTTEKDAQNLGTVKFGERPLYVAVIDLSVAPEADFKHIVEKTIAAPSGVPA